MTTVILSIIGIVLAAASALMVVYYGGASFEQSRVTANANQVINTAGYVLGGIKAMQMDYGNSVSISSSTDAARFDLFTRSSGPSGTYMNGFPQLPSPLIPALTIGNQYQVLNMPADACKRVNEVLKLPAPTSVSTSVKMGCYTPSGSPTGTFFANP